MASETSTENDIQSKLCREIIRCVNFAAIKHKDQRRKDEQQSPYINHVIGMCCLGYSFIAMDVNTANGSQVKMGKGTGCSLMKSDKKGNENRSIQSNKMHMASVLAESIKGSVKREGKKR